MSTVCPACGVVVVPGYVRCPKCRAALPLGRTKRTTVDPGGTAVVRREFPTVPVVAAVAVVAAVVAMFAMSDGAEEPEAVPSVPLEPIEATAVGDPLARPTFAPAPAPAAALSAADAAAQALTAAVADLEGSLRMQRLWGRVVIIGPRIDVRSGSCSNPAMAPLIDGKTALLRSAGLTKLRCVEQSGAVVFERDL